MTLYIFYLSSSHSLKHVSIKEYEHRIISTQIMSSGFSVSDLHCGLSVLIISMQIMSTGFSVSDLHYGLSVWITNMDYHYHRKTSPF